MIWLIHVCYHDGREARYADSYHTPTPGQGPGFVGQGVKGDSPMIGAGDPMLQAALPSAVPNCMHTCLMDVTVYFHLQSVCTSICILSYMAATHKQTSQPFSTQACTAAEQEGTEHALSCASAGAAVLPGTQCYCCWLCHRSLATLLSHVYQTFCFCSLPAAMPFCATLLWCCKVSLPCWFCSMLL